MSTERDPCSCGVNYVMPRGEPHQLNSLSTWKQQHDQPSTYPVLLFRVAHTALSYSPLSSWTPDFNMTDGLESIIPTTRSSYRMRLKRHFGADINTSWTDLPLLICCFKTGLLDAAVFNVWSCFVSMQTGIFLPNPTRTDRNPDSKTKETLCTSVWA